MKSLIFILFFISSVALAQESYRERQIGQLGLNDLSKVVANDTVLRIWIDYTQVIELCIHKNKIDGIVVTYVERVDDNGRTKVYTGKKHVLTNLNAESIESLYSKLNKLQDVAVKNHDEFISARYDFELMLNGEYFQSLLPKEQHQDLQDLFKSIEEQYDVESLYGDFKRKLKRGIYFDGFVTFTKH